MGRTGGESVLYGLAVSMLVLFLGCGGGGSDSLTETDLFTRMIGYYQVSKNYYTNGDPTGSWSGCEALEPYNTWSMFFEDMDYDAAHSGFLESNLEYTSDSVRYDWSWEDSPGVTCTEFQEYVFGGQGATYSYESEEACGDTTRRWEAAGTRVGPTDTPNDAIREADPLDFGTMVTVTLDPGDMDFFTFTLDHITTVDALFQKGTGNLSSVNHDLYYGERWGPSGSVTSDTWYDLEAKTYHLIVFGGSCDESGTFDLTLSESAR